MTEAYLGTTEYVLLKISEALLKLMIFLLSSSRVRKVMRACFSQLKEKRSASQRDGANLNSLGALELRRLALMSQFFGSCLAPSE